MQPRRTQERVRKQRQRSLYWKDITEKKRIRAQVELWFGSYICYYICFTKLKFSLIITLGVLPCLNILF